MHRLFFWFLLFIVAAGCDILTGNDGSMRLSGRVTEGTNPISGARIALSGIQPYTRSGSLGVATSDASGQYSIKIEPPEGYAEVNCYVISVLVTASGYVEAGGPLSWFTECSGDEATANFSLSRFESTEAAPEIAD